MVELQPNKYSTCQTGLQYPTFIPWDASQVIDSDEDVVISHNWAEIRRFMWNYVGIVRQIKRLQRALNRSQLLAREIQDFYANYRITTHLIELRNLVVVAELIIRCALKRKEGGVYISHLITLIYQRIQTTPFSFQIRPLISSVFAEFSSFAPDSKYRHWFRTFLTRKND